jgi:3-oxoacyl-[acyl-carrier protein] reductase
MKTFAGKVALVTGAGRGIGATIADHFEARGCTVHRGDIEGGNLRLDVTSRGSVAEAMERIRRNHGGLDILVNNAGLICTGPADETPGEEWDRLVATNLTGLFNCIQAALPLMAGRAGASIVNIASVASEKGGIGNVPTAPQGGSRRADQGLRRTEHPTTPLDRGGYRDDPRPPDRRAHAEGDRASAGAPDGEVRRREGGAVLASEDAAFITGETSRTVDSFAPETFRHRGGDHARGHHPGHHRFQGAMVMFCHRALVGPPSPGARGAPVSRSPPRPCWCSCPRSMARIGPIIAAARDRAAGAWI